jgi:phosphoribosylformimino-5-aminoimidazole carboxamide ribotide isomerase
MRIIPVLDLLGSQVVRGVAGKRDQYRPLQSRLVEGSDPIAVAKAIRGEFGLTEFYVADLDAILHRRPTRATLKTLVDDRFCLLVDAGIRCCEDAAPIFELGIERLVAGLETLESPSELEEIIRRYGSERIVFSLDLRDGQALASAAAWQAADPFGIGRCVIEAGCTQLIVLDIARVGTAGGVPTLGLCDKIHRAFPAVTILTGGGVRGIDDLRTLDRAGIDGVLIASALHDGSIARSDLTSFGERPA